MSRDMSDVRAEVPAAGLDEDERMAEARERLKDANAVDVDQEQVVANAEERIDDIEEEFGPNPPRRGATPENPNAEEAPS
ncbi:MAG: hypothetical protein QM747_18260 [Nocardioides sp.]